MIKTGQTKHSATVIRLNFVFAHDDGLLMPQDWNYGTDRLGGANMALNSGGRGFERFYRHLFSSVEFWANCSRFDWYLATARWSRDTHDSRNLSPVLSPLHNQGHGTGSVGSISRFLVHTI